MTPDLGSEPRPRDPDANPSAARLQPPLRVPAAACPFLIAEAGAYRMSIPDREHRCAAFVPATSLALSKQSRLCLTPNHPGCATYIASTSARAARTGLGERIERSGRWGLARTTPVVEQVGGLRATLGALISDRRTWPAIPAVLLATLLLALGLSGSWSQGPVTALTSLTPTTGPDQNLGPTRAPSARPSLGPAPSGAPPTDSPPTDAPATAPATAVPATAIPATAAPPPAITPTPLPAYTNYRVKPGDTLYDIARTFKTTVAAIEQLNDLTTTNLHIGQVLKIPKG
jgi:hypothetical protein